ncbi:MAG: hypothetical protein GAK40_00170 [Burkholderia plantarii]|nr:MAG: hypothetical protein GAK40_00170 [Burkholderia plantarii]
MSSSKMPSTSATSDTGISASGTHATISSTSAAAVVRPEKPRSAQRPARDAASAPAAPASPNAPIAVCDRLNGGALSGSTSALQNALSAANNSSASTPRMRKAGSSRSNATIEASNCV